MFAVDGDRHRDPQLVKALKIRGCVMLRPKQACGSVSHPFLPRPRDHCGRGDEKMARARGGELLQRNSVFQVQEGR